MINNIYFGIAWCFCIANSTCNFWWISLCKSRGLSLSCSLLSVALISLVHINFFQHTLIRWFCILFSCHFPSCSYPFFSNDPSWGYKMIEIWCKYTIYRIEGSNNFFCIKPIVSNPPPHNMTVSLFHETIVIFMIWSRAC